MIHAGIAVGVSACARDKNDATSAVARCLQRIDDIDKHGPVINSVIEVNPEALKIAAAVARKTVRGVLHGAPILIKDNIETADAMETTAGSLALVGSKPKRDAFIVERLRAAGLVLMGKTNLSEWANIRSSKSTSGWSARGGLTRNPHRLDYNTSGSSSGSAAAVAAGLVSLAIGTETNGSIVSPASACGIVGLKPTMGLVSRSGIIPITPAQDTAGPMTRSVREAALLLSVIAGADARDPATVDAVVQDYAVGLVPGALRGKRLGVVRSLAGENTKVLALFDEALKAMRDAGAVIIDPVVLPHHEELGRPSFVAMLAEFRSALNAYLADRGAQVRSLAEVMAFNEAHREQEMPHFAQEFFVTAEKLGTEEAVAMAAEARTLVKRLSGPEGIDAALREHSLDALICPTNDPVHRTDLVNGDTRGRVCSSPAAIAGYPHLTVPMGFVDDLPIGLSFMGAAWGERGLLAIGHGFEEVMPAFREPRFLR
jgi:amidase